jgi:hypothetical protein
MRETITDSSKQCYRGIATEEPEKKEQRTHRSLDGDDGAAAVSAQRQIKSPCNAAGRRDGGGVVDDAAERR